MLNLVIAYKSGKIEFAQVALSGYPAMLQQLGSEGRVEYLKIEAT